MKKAEAQYKATLTERKVKALERIFEVLDIAVTEKLIPGTPDFAKACDALGKLEEAIGKMQGEAMLLANIAEFLED